MTAKQNTGVYAPDGSLYITLTDGAGNLASTSGGSGTVSSVSVTTANGISGTVATSTTTPAISLTLGAITPSSVVTSGVLNSSLSTDASSISTGSGIFSGGVGIAKKLYVGSATQASSSTVAGVVLSGGLGIAKDIISAGNIYVPTATSSVGAIGIGSFTLKSNSTNFVASDSTYPSALISGGGTGNIIIGHAAGTALSDASNCFALGPSALHSNISGTGVVAIGSTAGFFATGNEGVFIGLNAGAAVTSGTRGVYIGSNAGNGTTITGTQNVAVGFGAGGSLTGAVTLVTCVGSNAGGGVTTGNVGVYLGYSAGSSITTGDYNTVVGPASTTGITTGRANTILGSVSGLSTSLSNNIILADGDGFIRAQYGTGWTLSGFVKLPSYTVAGLPSASTSGAGSTAFVTDASTTLVLGLGGTVAGGGSNKVPVYSDGTNWVYG